MKRNKRGFSFVFMLFVTLLLVGCTGGGTSVEEGQLFGKIYDENESLFTGSVLVTLDGKKGTIAEGSYSFEKVAAGTKVLKVVAEGYQDYEAKIELSKNEKKEHDVFLVMDTKPRSDPYKIAVITGSASQGEEEYYAAQRMVNLYPEIVNHRTYPDNFMGERDAYISQIMEFANDEEYKAIVVCQAIPGTVTAFEQARNLRADLLLIAGTTHEDLPEVAAVADFVLNIDQIGRGTSIATLAKEMGAEKIFHYSFARHMNIDILKSRRDAMKIKAESLGMEFVDITTPDPLGDAGVVGLQQFIIDDIRQQVSVHGKDIAFFGTNCAMLEPAIKTCLETEMLFPEQCCPNPFHGYPRALEIEIPDDKKGDVEYILTEVEAAIAAKGGSGRFATWRAPAYTIFVEAGVEFAKRWIEGELEIIDASSIEEVIFDFSNVQVTLSNYASLANAYEILVESVIF